VMGAGEYFGPRRIVDHDLGRGRAARVATLFVENDERLVRLARMFRISEDRPHVPAVPPRRGGPVVDRRNRLVARAFRAHLKRP